MGKVKRVLRCYRCGQVLQSQNKNISGYVSKAYLTSHSEGDVVYCESCLETVKAINSGYLDARIDKQTLTILEDAKAMDGLIIWTIDLFAFNGWINPEIVKIIKNNKVVVVATKRDLFSKSVKDTGLLQYLTERFNEAGINPVAIHLVGKDNEDNIKEFIANLDTVRTGHDVYMIGSSASGKTNLINRGMKYYDNKTNKQIAHISYPKTDLKVLRIPLSKTSYLYEVPGFSLNASTIGKVEKETLKYIVPKKEIKSSLKVMMVNDAIMLGSLGAFGLIKGKTTTFKFYTAPGVEFKKSKVEHLFSLMLRNLDDKETRPTSNRFKSFQDYDVFEYTMENDNKSHDIAIEGLGWASFVAKGQVIRVVLPRGVVVKESLSKIR